jgi:hypothetical protein
MKNEPKQKIMGTYNNHIPHALLAYLFISLFSLGVDEPKHESDSFYIPDYQQKCR